MKAFTTHKFFVCQLTGQTIVEYSYQGKGNFFAQNKSFTTKENALAYLGQHKRDWFLQCLETWVLHKKHIIEISNTEAKRNDLSICLEALKHYETKSLETICKKFITGIKYFNNILPNPNNDSYKSSLTNLNELIKFCELEVKNTIN